MGFSWYTFILILCTTTLLYSSVLKYSLYSCQNSLLFVYYLSMKSGRSHVPLQHVPYCSNYLYILVFFILIFHLGFYVAPIIFVSGQSNSYHNYIRVPVHVLNKCIFLNSFYTIVIPEVFGVLPFQPCTTSIISVVRYSRGQQASSPPQESRGDPASLYGRQTLTRLLGYGPCQIRRRDITPTTATYD